MNTPNTPNTPNMQVWEALEADGNGMTQGERMNIGLAGYEAWLDTVTLPPDLQRYLDDKIREVNEECDDKIRSIRETRLELLHQKIIATRSGVMLKGVYRAWAASQALTRGVSFLEQKAKWSVEDKNSLSAHITPNIKPDDIDRMRDELNVISGMHRGISLVWLCEAIREWRIKTVRLQTYVNVDHTFGLVADCPMDRHLGKTFRLKTNTAYWSTWNQIAMVSVGLLGSGNWLGIPLFGFMETPENVKRYLHHTDITYSPAMRGAVASLALTMNEAIEIEQAVEEHTNTNTALEERDVKQEWQMWDEIIEKFLELEQTGEILGYGENAVNWLKRNWYWVAIAAAIAIMTYIFLYHPPTIPGITPFNNTTNLTNLSEYTNWTIQNGTLVIYD